MDDENGSGLDPNQSSNPVEGVATSLTKPSGGQGVLPAKGDSQVPAEMPNEEDDSAWEGLPKWIRDLRRENASKRKKLQDVEQEKTTILTELETLRQKDLTEQEKNQEKLRKLETEEIPSLRKQNQILTVKLHAAQHNLVDPDAVVKLLDWDRVDKGEDIDALLTQLVEEKPYLRKPDAQAGKPAAKSSTSPAAPAAPGTTPAVLNRSALKNMTPEQINSAWESGDLQTQLKSGRVDE